MFEKTEHKYQKRPGMVYTENTQGGASLFEFFEFTCVTTYRWQLIIFFSKIQTKIKLETSRTYSDLTPYSECSLADILK